MALIALKTDPTRRELRMFALVWVPLFVGLAGLLIWHRTGSFAVPRILWGGAVLVALLGAVRATAVRPVFLALIYATAPIGWLVSHLVLAFVYYGVVTPIGVLLRTFGRDPMTRGFDRNATTYYEEAARERTARDYLRQF